MKNLFAFILFIMTFFLGYYFYATPTFAEGLYLKVSPSLIRIEAKPPADVWTPFTLENQSDQPVSLTIGYKTFDPQSSSNGHVVFINVGDPIPGTDKKIFDKMQIVDDQNLSHDTITLGPQQKMRLRLRILLPDSEPTSDYYFSLIFLQQPIGSDQNISIYNIEGQKSYTTLQTGIGMNVLLAVGDKEAPQASIQSFSAPLFSSHGPVPFTIEVSNSGNHFLVPRGQILIKNIFGQTIGKVEVPPSVILAGTSRTFISSSEQSELLWPESFVLGAYTARLTLSLSDKGPVYERSIHFLGFPFALFVEILIALLIIGYIYLRVKRKISY